MVMEYRAKTPIVSCTTDGLKVTLYTCPPNCRAKIPLVFIVNANGSVTVTLEIYKAANTTSYYILASKSMATGEYIQLKDSYIVLEPGDKIEVTPVGTTPIVDALCTVEEEFIANRGL